MAIIVEERATSEVLVASAGKAEFDGQITLLRQVECPRMIAANPGAVILPLQMQSPGQDRPLTQTALLPRPVG